MKTFKSVMAQTVRCLAGQNRCNFSIGDRSSSNQHSISSTSPIPLKRGAGGDWRDSTSGRLSSLELRETRESREWNYVPNILHAGHVHKESLESETESRVWHGAELAQFEVPPVRGLIETHRADL